MSRCVEFWPLLRLTQEYISENYAAALTDKEKLSQLKAYIEQFLRDNEYEVDRLTLSELTDKLYGEMAGYSVLTPYLGSPLLEEIDINAWNDIGAKRSSITKCA